MGIFHFKPPFMAAQDCDMGIASPFMAAQENNQGRINATYCRPINIS